MSTLHGSTCLFSLIQGAIGGDAKSVADAQRLLKSVVDGPAVALTGREQGDNDLGCGIHREEIYLFGDFAEQLLDTSGAGRFFESRGVEVENVGTRQFDNTQYLKL